MLGEYASFWRNLIPGDLLTQEILHGVFSLPFALLIFKKTKLLKLFLLVVIVTYLIDLDHWVDYFLYFGNRFEFSLFLSGVYFEMTKRAVVPFHAWEWILLLGLIARRKGWKSFYAVLTLSLLAHLIFDTITVGHPLFYSIIYRYLKGFTNLI